MMLRLRAGVDDADGEHGRRERVDACGSSRSAAPAPSRRPPAPGRGTGAGTTRARRARGPSTSSPSLAAISGPGRVATVPARGQVAHHVQGEGGVGAGVRRRPARPRRSCAAAPSKPSSPGWNMKTTSPASRSRVRRQQLGGADQHRRVQVVPAGVHRAVHLRAERDVDLLGHRQRVHVAAQQDDGPRRRSSGCRGRAPCPRRTAVTDVQDVAGADLQRQPVERLPAPSPGCAAGRRPISGWRCSRCRRSVEVVGQVTGVGEEIHAPFLPRARSAGSASGQCVL